MEVHINRKLIIIVTTLLTILVGAAVVLRLNGGFTPLPTATSVGTRNMTPRPTEPQSANANTPEEAAVAFAKAFYTVNYTDYDGWLSGLKTVSTNDGYAILTKSIVPAVWPEIEKARTVTPTEAVKAEDAGLVLEGDSQIGGPWQIRNVNVRIDSTHLWPTMKSGGFTAMVMLAQQDGQWRFVSFITPDQIEQIKKGQQP